VIDIVKVTPSSEKKLSKAKNLPLECYDYQRKLILVACGGPMGYSVLVDRLQEIAQHIF
jgi:hypothetical protein